MIKFVLGVIVGVAWGVIAAMIVWEKAKRRDEGRCGRGS